MLVILAIALVVTMAGFCKVDSMAFILLCFNAPGVRRPTRGLSAELLCVLGGQSLPTIELHRLATSNAADGSPSKKTIQNVEADVPTRGAPRDEAAIDVVPQPQARAAINGFEFPTDIVVLEHLGSVSSRHSCLERRGRSHPGELYRATRRTQAPLGIEGRPLAQMRRV